MYLKIPGFLNSTNSLMVWKCKTVRKLLTYQKHGMYLACPSLFLYCLERALQFARSPSEGDIPALVPLIRPYWALLGKGWFSLTPFFAQGGLKMKLMGNEREAWVYSFLAIHIFTAFSTARVKSPFFPPNSSIVLNLSCFSSSSESSTHIRPILNRQL